MELYSRSPQASMTMASDHGLSDLLKDLIKDDSIDVAVETGTFLGTGSTRLIADAFIETRIPKRFVTIEVNFSNWCQAKKNLVAYPFVDCRWGCAVGFDEARSFMRADEFLNNHHAYDGIYIDDVEDPLSFYLKELTGSIPFTQSQPVTDAQSFLWEGERLLQRMLFAHREHNPLVILDSAGGTGFLEFQLMIEVMQEKPYSLLLDDTRHLKHFRSLQYLRTAPEFEIVGEGLNWVLAMHHQT